MGYAADAVFFGNSITRGSDFYKYFEDKRIVNLGYSGDSMKGMMRRMDMLRAVSPDKVFMMAGINGFASQSLDEFTQQYNALTDSVRNACPQSEIYLESILPVNHCRFDIYGSNDKIIAANKIIATIAQQKGMTYMDLFSLYFMNGELPDELTHDGIHLWPKSYDRWAETIRPYIYDE